ncbi:gephyrin-like molybdotransferase Glp [Phreatobacter sp.]|uniref:molybdopterin molybdotransferase MoeA n=1 Tax=Phreatobacter sp. TaxID=1966341 RepID=UPI0022C15646|nr:gephyrin-like molybdotransferase Glp [Phreatobacter sp.]MCZ8316330.1 molybdopterin molybdotransferase MoeA [Phreatobacter sp.]
MAGLLPVEEALARVLDGASPLPEEWIPVADCDGRVLTRDLVASRSQPPEDMSSMDGYALRAADLPGRLTVVGEAAAGRGFPGEVGDGQAARIFTGAPIPDGADAVVMQEDTSRDGDTVIIDRTARAGQFIRRRGLDFTAGVTGLPAGTVMNPRSLALAAAMNHASVPVHRRPRVAILSTGDELVEPGTAPGPNQIVSSNALAIAAIARRAGADVTHLGIAPDRLEATLSRVRDARDGGHDILVTSGGASVGEYDLMREVIRHEGGELGFWKIAMRPGKPLMMADLGATRLLGLPGNPVASFVCAMLFLEPLIARLAGRLVNGPTTAAAVLGADVPANDLRADHLRARVIETDGRLVATPFPVQDSSMIRVLAEADALILRPAHAPAARQGDPCRIVRLPR